MPEGGREAIEAGVVGEADPTWMYSDAYGASNGFTLTEGGREIVLQAGWVCGCPKCYWHPRGKPPERGLASPRQQMCSMCRAGIQQYGAAEDGSCKGHTISYAKWRECGEVTP